MRVSIPILLVSWFTWLVLLTGCMVANGEAAALGGDWLLLVLWSSVGATAWAGVAIFARRYLALDGMAARLGASGGLALIVAGVLAGVAQPLERTLAAAPTTRAALHDRGDVSIVPAWLPIAFAAGGLVLVLFALARFASRRANPEMQARDDGR
jgi:hypothetical protein